MSEAARDSGSRHIVPLPGGTSARRRQTVQADRDALARAQRISRTGSWEFDHRTRQLIVSDELLAMCGVTRDAIAFGGRALVNGVADVDRELVETAMRDLVENGTSVDLRYRGVRPDNGEVAWFSARGQVERDETGAMVRATCVITDIDELVQTEHELRAADAFQQAVIATTPDAIHIYDLADGTFIRANRSATPLIGFTPRSVTVLSGTDLDDVVPIEDWAELTATLGSAADLADGEVAHVQQRVYEPDGTITWLSRRMSVFARDPEGRATQLLVVSRDVSHAVEMRQLLQHAATHDELTGLPHRRQIQDLLDAFLAGDGTRAAAVLVVDLDGFKRINDGQGHAMGDAVLREVARRLTNATRPADAVARLGGDEFVVVLWTDSAEIASTLSVAVAGRIEAALAEPIVSQGRECWVTASIGVSVVDQDSASEAALAEADAAMYSVKKHGAHGFAVYDSAFAARARRHDWVERNLRRALRDDAVGVHYQPIVAPGSGLLSAVEALVRIHDEDGNPIDAAAVIEVAESSGLVSELDDRVLRQASAQVAEWRDSPLYRNLRLTINRSAQDLLRAGFHDRIVHTLATTALPASALTLEITETVLLDADVEAMGDVRKLYEHGVRLALDDFGTGYASLSQLTKLPISAIKIDRSFTTNMLHDRTCRALVRATVGIAEDLRMECIVEGVETEEHLAALPRYERLLIQGYLYGRPRPAHEGLGVNLAHW
jgi:diguanylate cyclase (GGDEF)-like protein/PAS domain S-box-containing protein